MQRRTAQLVPSGQCGYIFSLIIGLMAFSLKGQEENPFVELLEKDRGQNRTGKPLFVLYGNRAVKFDVTRLFRFEN